MEGTNCTGTRAMRKTTMMMTMALMSTTGVGTFEHLLAQEAIMVTAMMMITIMVVAGAVAAKQWQRLW